MHPRGGAAASIPPQPAGLSCFSPWQELAKFQELIFEDFASFILVENTYEEVVLQSVMKDIMQGRALCGICVGSG